MKHNSVRRGFTQKNTVILNLIQDLQRLLLQLVNNLRGRFQIKFGMTSLFNKGAFTLIELLVVVLIIGILAAVAVPQYQVAVGKARFMELITLGDAIIKAEKVYYLSNGTYTKNLAELDLELPENTHLEGLGVNVTNAFLAARLKDLNAYYIVFLKSGRRECRATNNLGRKICASLTKNNEGHNESSPEYWVRYL